MISNRANIWLDKEQAYSCGYFELMISRKQVRHLWWFATFEDGGGGQRDGRCLHKTWAEHLSVSTKFIAVVSCSPPIFSAAGEFFPEAAQVAYQMWELSAVAKVEVRTHPCLPPPISTLLAWIPSCFTSCAADPFLLGLLASPVWWVTVTTTKWSPF